MENQPNDNASPAKRRFRILPPLRRTVKSSFGGASEELNPAGITARVILWVFLGFFAIFGIVFVSSGFHNVDATERAVVFHSNGSLTILPPGKFQWVTPIFNTVTVYDVRDVTYTENAVGISLDLQETTTEITVRYHPDPAAIQTIHQTLGTGYESKVVHPAVQGCVKDSVSFHNVEELTGSIRAQVASVIKECVEQSLGKGYLVTTAVTVTDFDFSSQFNAAIEAKAIAQQKAQEEKNRLEQVKYQANQTIVQAQAQAEAARLLSQAANSQEGSAYLFLEWLKKWDGHLPQVLNGGEGQSVILQLPQGVKN